MITEKKLYLIISSILVIIITVLTIRHFLPGTLPEEPLPYGITERTEAYSTKAVIPVPEVSHSAVPETKSSVPAASSVSQPIPESSADSTNKLININTAGISELTQLKGIGEKKAQSIIEYRESSSGFGSIEEIMNVKGIGEKTFENIKDKLCV